MELSSTRLHTENELVTITEGLFLEMNFHVYKEVPLFSSSVDMILVNDDLVYAVEFKLHNWKRAIKQVKRHAISVDYIYICLPKMKTETTKQKIESMCREEGVGLFYVDFDGGQPYLEEAIRPEKPNFVWKKQRENLLNYLAVNCEMR